MQACCSLVLRGAAGTLTPRGTLPDVVQEDVRHHFGSRYNGALGFVESAGVVFNVAHLPHQRGYSPAAEKNVRT